MVKAQGGNTELLDDTSKFKKSKFSLEVKANDSGYIKSINALELGRASVLLGAGRTTKEDIIDITAGIVLSKKEGSTVNAGETILTLYSNDKNKLDLAKSDISNTFIISENKPQIKPLIYKKIN